MWWKKNARNHFDIVNMFEQLNELWQLRGLGDWGGVAKVFKSARILTDELPIVASGER